MKPFATLLVLGLVCGAAAANLTCVKTPAEFVANLETINYQKLIVSRGRHILHSKRRSRSLHNDAAYHVKVRDGLQEDAL